MELGFFIKGLIVGFLASIPLGPVGVLCIQRTINKGRFSGIISGMGADTVDSFFALVAALGLTFIINFIEEQQFFIQIIGGGVVVFLGAKIFYTNPVKQIRRHRRKKNKLIEDYFSVLFLTISNPLAIFLFVAAFAGIGIVSSKDNSLDSSLIVGGVFVGAMAWWAILTFFIDLFRKRFRLKQLWWINKIAGVILVIFGALAMLTIFIE
ncbi:MAG: lysine transporter LysE [Marinilabiliales bacterium]|nr:MAG: lysine transporter LysE [Marinilabiliales bacterium]